MIIKLLRWHIQYLAEGVMNEEQKILHQNLTTKMNLSRMSYESHFLSPKTVMSLNFSVTPEVHVHFQFIRFHSYNILPAGTSIFIISIAVRNNSIKELNFLQQPFSCLTSLQYPTITNIIFMSIQEIHVRSPWVLDKIPSENRSVSIQQVLDSIQQVLDKIPFVNRSVIQHVLTIY